MEEEKSRGTQIEINDVVAIDPDEQSAAVSHPSIVSFRNGAVPANLNTVKFTMKKRRRVQDRDKKDNNADEDADEPHPELFAKGSTGRMWHAESGHNDVNCNYYIGVRNKKTRKIRLVQTNVIYNMRPYVSPTVGAHLWEEIDRKDRNTEENENDETYVEKRKKLLDAFGGKKSIQRVARYERNRVTDDKVDEKTVVQINEAAKEMLVKDAEIGIHHNTIETTEAAAPPHDSAATTPEEAYPLVGLISPRELHALRDLADVLLQGQEDHATASENPGWHPVVWKVLRSIIIVGDTPSEERIYRMQCAMHLHYLIMLATKKRKITRNNHQSFMDDMAVDQPILQLLLHRFTTKETDSRADVRVKTAEDSARITKHAILMWMFALGFSNCGMLDELAESLELQTKVLLHHANNLGCKVRKQKETKGPQAYRITLKAPLVFPPIRKRKGRPQ